MKRILFLGVLAMSMLACSNIEDDDDVTLGNWSRQSDFEGKGRSSTVYFVIDDYAYVGLGTDGSDYLKDFWRYDPQLNFWEQMASFEGVGRIGCFSFSANGKGYMGTGYNDELDEEELSDFWEYDPSTNKWTQKADFGGGARYNALSFGINGKGYAGAGYNGNYLKDIWVYNPENDTWAQTISINQKRESAFSFVIDGVAYVGGGRNNGAYIYDFSSFDPTKEQWTDLTLFDDEDDTYDEFYSAVQRYSASTFAIDGVGYVVCGVSNTYSTAVFAYYPESNSWSSDPTNFEYTSRGDAASFAIGGIGYVATGRNSSSRFDDIWSFDPDVEYDEYR